MRRAARDSVIVIRLLFVQRRSSVATGCKENCCYAICTEDLCKGLYGSPKSIYR